MAHKDGFCRAPRIEMVSESTSFENKSFEELLVKANLVKDDEVNMSIVKQLAKGSQLN